MIDDTILDPLFVTIVLLAVLTVVLLRRRRLVGLAPVLLAGGALLVLGAASYRPVSVGLLELLERGQTPLDTAAQPAPDAILVLGAGFRERATPRAVLTDAGKERLLEGVRLARAWPKAALVFSGGSLAAFDRGSSGAEMGRRAIEAGVDSSRVIVDSRAKTTHGNAVECAAIARGRGWKRLVVVTSARHMPRSLAAFRAVGLDPTPAPCDFTGLNGPGDWYSVSVGGVANIHTFLHEVVGRVWYRLRGW